MSRRPAATADDGAAAALRRRCAGRFDSDTLILNTFDFDSDHFDSGCFDSEGAGRDARIHPWWDIGMIPGAVILILEWFGMIPGRISILAGRAFILTCPGGRRVDSG